MKEKVLRICEKICCRTITSEELLLSDRMDSFQIMELICSLEETFDIILSPDEIMDLDHFSTVDNILKLVTDKMLLVSQNKNIAEEEKV